MGPHSSIGAPAKYNYEAPEGEGGGGACLGASLGPRGGRPPGGLQLSSAGTVFMFHKVV